MLQRMVHGRVIRHTSVISTHKVIEAAEGFEFHARNKLKIELVIHILDCISLTYRTGRMTIICERGNASRSNIAEFSRLYFM